jgi:hypothetical protein
VPVCYSETGSLNGTTESSAVDYNDVIVSLVEKGQLVGHVKEDFSSSDVNYPINGTRWVGVSKQDISSKA